MDQDPRGTLTPDEAADLLGMSRAHLCKLIDAEQVPTTGHDRRIRLSDLLDIEQRLHGARAELAERFARSKATERAAIEQVAHLL